MMRRGGMFGAIAETQALIPHESDTGQVLEAKWNKWVQKESFKRLADKLLPSSPTWLICYLDYAFICFSMIPEHR
jgi:hypothetical protein